MSDKIKKNEMRGASDDYAREEKHLQVTMVKSEQMKLLGNLGLYWRIVV